MVPQTDRVQSSTTVYWTKMSISCRSLSPPRNCLKTCGAYWIPYRAVECFPDCDCNTFNIMLYLMTHSTYGSQDRVILESDLSPTSRYPRIAGIVEMTVVRIKHSSLFQVVAIGLLVTYGSITTAINLLHNHKDLVEKANCPACIWLQMNQDSDPEVSPADEVIPAFEVIAYLPPPLEASISLSCDVSCFHLIRAPPAF